MNALSSPQREQSLDLFRGLTVLLMILANTTSRIAGLPWWMNHSFNVPGKWDQIAWLDYVFPAFLFMMGMAVPLALERRRARGQGVWRLLGHVGLRSFWLIWIGTIIEAYWYREDATGVTTPAWYFWGWVCVTGLLGTGALTAARGRPWRWLGWAIRAASLGFFIWASFALRAGPNRADGQPGGFFTGGYIPLPMPSRCPDGPAFPASIIGYLGITYLTVSLLWLALRDSRVGRLGAYVVFLAIFYQFDQPDGFLRTWLGGVADYLDPGYRFGSYASMTLAGTFVGELFLLPGGQGRSDGSKRTFLLGFLAVLAVVAALLGTDFFRTFTGIRRVLVLTAVPLAIFWLLWEVDRAVGRARGFGVATRPLTELGRNALFVFFLQYGLAGGIDLAMNRAGWPEFINVVPGYILWPGSGWSVVLTRAVPYTLLATAVAMLANRLKVIVRL